MYQLLLLILYFDQHINMHKITAKQKTFEGIQSALDRKSRPIIKYIIINLIITIVFDDLISRPNLQSMKT